MADGSLARPCDNKADYRQRVNGGRNHSHPVAAGVFATTSKYMFLVEFWISHSPYEPAAPHSDGLIAMRLGRYCSGHPSCSRTEPTKVSETGTRRCRGLPVRTHCEDMARMRDSLVSIWSTDDLSHPEFTRARHHTFAFEPHFYSTVCLALIVSGALKLTIGRRTETAAKGAFVFINAGDVHGGSCDVRSSRLGHADAPRRARQSCRADAQPRPPG